MKAYICNECRLHVEPPPQGYDLPPDRWYTLGRQGPPWVGSVHLCSTACLTMHALKLEADEKAKATTDSTPVAEEAPRG